MKLYLTIISIATLLISIFNIAFNTATWYYIIISVVWCTAMQFAIDGVIATIIRLLPEKWFNVDNAFYGVSKKEIALYKKLKVKQWKDKVWELGGMGGFSKKSLQEPNNSKYIEKFVIECNKGVLVHRISYFLGFLVMFMLPNICALSIALPVAVVNLFLNILPTIVLRYNTPTLKHVLEKLRKKEQEKIESIT